RALATGAPRGAPRPPGRSARGQHLGVRSPAARLLPRRATDLPARVDLALCGLAARRRRGRRHGDDDGQLGVLARRLRHRDPRAAHPRDVHRRPRGHRDPGARRRVALHVPRHGRGRCRHAVAAEARARDALRRGGPHLPRAARGTPRGQGRIGRNDHDGMSHGEMSMERRRLGTSGLEVTRLGLGLAAIGRPGYITLGRARDLPATRSPDALWARCAEVLDAARAAGIRYVDAARSYGRAEEFLGRWLVERGVARDEVTVGSKWGYRYTAGWAVDAPVHEQKEHSVERFRAQLAETRALVGDRLDLYQIHSATIDSGALGNADLLAAL